MPGILDIGASHKQSAMRGFGVATELEDKRNMVEKNLDQAERAQKASNIGTGAAVGAAAGAAKGSVGGPWGAVIGAAVGYLASEMF